MRKLNNTKKLGLKAAIRTSKSVSDILAKDDLNGMLRDMEDEKMDITDCIIIYKKQDGSIIWQITDDTLTSTATWMLESTKLDVLKED